MKRLVWGLCLVIGLSIGGHVAAGDTASATMDDAAASTQPNPLQGQVEKRDEALAELTKKLPAGGMISCIAHIVIPYIIKRYLDHRLKKHDEAVEIQLKKQATSGQGFNPYLLMMQQMQGMTPEMTDEMGFDLPGDTDDSQAEAPKITHDAQDYERWVLSHKKQMIFKILSRIALMWTMGGVLNAGNEAWMWWKNDRAPQACRKNEFDKKMENAKNELALRIQQIESREDATSVCVKEVQKETALTEVCNALWGDFVKLNDTPDYEVALKKIAYREELKRIAACSRYLDEGRWPRFFNAICFPLGTRASLYFAPSDDNKTDMTNASNDHPRRAAEGSE